MKKFNYYAKVTELKRLFNSTCGNPRFEVVLKLESEKILTGKTQTDAKVGYMIESYKDSKIHLFTCHYTKNNNLIIERVDA